MAVLVIVFRLLHVPLAANRSAAIPIGADDCIAAAAAATGQKAAQQKLLAVIGSRLVGAGSRAHLIPSFLLPRPDPRPQCFVNDPKFPAQAYAVELD